MIVYGFLKVHGELLLLSFSHRAEREVRQEKKRNPRVRLPCKGLRALRFVF